MPNELYGLRVGGFLTLLTVTLRVLPEVKPLVAVNKPVTVIVSDVPEPAGLIVAEHVALPVKSPPRVQIVDITSTMEPGLEAPRDLYSHLGRVITRMPVDGTIVPIVREKVIDV